MRIIYNTSYIINDTIEQEWLSFMKEDYLPLLRNYRLCNDIIFSKVSIDQPEGKTYSLQMVFESPEQQQYFLHHCLAELEEKVILNFTGQYVCFSSLLTEI